MAALQHIDGFATALQRVADTGGLSKLTGVELQALADGGAAWYQLAQAELKRRAVLGDQGGTA